MSRHWLIGTNQLALVRRFMPVGTSSLPSCRLCYAASCTLSRAHSHLYLTHVLPCDHAANFWSCCLRQRDRLSCGAGLAHIHMSYPYVNLYDCAVSKVVASNRHRMSDKTISLLGMLARSLTNPPQVRKGPEGASSRALVSGGTGRSTVAWCCVGVS
eukprot:scaffold64942_cov22-Tisochrysis_lutea.AAC.1